MIYCEGQKCTNTSKTTDAKVTLPVQLLLKSTTAITPMNPRVTVRTNGVSTKLTPIGKLAPGIVLQPLELTNQMSPMNIVCLMDLVYSTVPVYSSNSVISVPSLKEMDGAELQCSTGTTSPVFTSGN